jgi:hypothetical protein
MGDAAVRNGKARGGKRVSRAARPANANSESVSSSNEFQWLRRRFRSGPGGRARAGGGGAENVAEASSGTLRPIPAPRACE